jgi:hypothetical protein
MTEEASARKNKVARTQWEYETLLIGNDKLTLSPAMARVAAAVPRPWPGTQFEDALNELGRAGWELVGLLPSSNARSRRCGTFTSRSAGTVLNPNLSSLGTGRW